MQVFNRFVSDRASLARLNRTASDLSHTISCCELLLGRLSASSFLDRYPSADVALGVNRVDFVTTDFAVKAVEARDMIVFESEVCRALLLECEASIDSLFLRLDEQEPRAYVAWRDSYRGPLGVPTMEQFYGDVKGIVHCMLNACDPRVDPILTFVTAYRERPLQEGAGS